MVYVVLRLFADMAASARRSGKKIYSQREVNEKRKKSKPKKNILIYSSLAQRLMISL